MEASDPDDFGDLSLSIATDDSAITRRVKAIAATRPLHDLERNKASFGGDHWDRYDLMSLAIATIDEVALAMGVSAGRSYDEALDHCARQAARQNPDDDNTEHELVASRVLGALLADVPEAVTYVDHTGHVPTQRRHEFRLLYEQWNPDETVHLRASEHAVNVLIDALDLDVESAQIAAEAQMRALLERGALDSAVEIARRAVYLTVQHLEQVRSILRDTQMDHETWDWGETVPAILRRALNHISDRITAETRLLSAVEDRRDAELDPVQRQRANELVRLLRSCYSRHLDLQRHLIGARQGYQFDVLRTTVAGSASLEQRRLRLTDALNAGGDESELRPLTCRGHDSSCAAARDDRAREEHVGAVRHRHVLVQWRAALWHGR